MKKLIILFIVPLLYCCTVLDDPIDTGIAESNIDQTMWEHFVNDTAWQQVTSAIEHAGIKYMFDGSDPDYQEVTFFGVTNQSIIRFLIENELKDVSDLAPEKCKMMLLSHMVTGKIMKDDCEFEIKGTNEGGTIVTSLTGKKIRIYRITTPGIHGPESGPQYLAIHALESGFKADVVSADNEFKNGVMHTLIDSYTWTEL